MALFHRSQGAEHESARQRCQPSYGRRVDRLLDALLPPLCPACDTPQSDPGGLCATCLHNLQALGWQCRHCALPLPNPNVQVCGACLHSRVRLDPVWAGFAFNTALRKMVHALKFQHKLVLAPLLGQQLLQHLPADIPGDGFDALIPAPLHISRLRERGFNQALELSRPLASSWHMPLRSDLLRRDRATRKQTHLDKPQRRANVNQAFSATPEVRGLRVLIFDDVMTTGATLHAMAKALRQAGAEQVGAITLARVT